MDYRMSRDSDLRFSVDLSELPENPENPSRLAHMATQNSVDTNIGERPLANNSTAIRLDY